jgi:transglutaminase-like putative cysteine protease
VRYRITHRTEYVYAEPVTLCHNEAHLTPRTTPDQHVHAHDVEIDPPPAVFSRRDDFFGNSVVYFAVQSPHPRLVVTARSDVERVAPGESRRARARAPWDESVACVRDDLTPGAIDAHQYALESPMVRPTAEIAAYAAPSFPAGRPLRDAVADLTARIHRDFTYEPGATTVGTPLAEVFARRHGVCQDFAHFAIACLRSLGLAARYVSGYIQTEPPAGSPRLIGADASHAWFATYAPDAGWLDFDPTNPHVAFDRHVTTAWGRDYSDVTPVKGIVFGGGAEHTATIAVDVEPIAMPPG